MLKKILAVSNTSLNKLEEKIPRRTSNLRVDSGNAAKCIAVILGVIFFIILYIELIFKNLDMSQLPSQPQNEGTSDDPNSVDNYNAVKAIGMGVILLYLLPKNYLGMPEKKKLTENDEKDPMERPISAFLKPKKSDTARKKADNTVLKSQTALSPSNFAKTHVITITDSLYYDSKKWIQPTEPQKKKKSAFKKKSSASQSSSRLNKAPLKAHPLRSSFLPNRLVFMFDLKLMSIQEIVSSIEKFTPIAQFFYVVDTDSAATGDKKRELKQIFENKRWLSFFGGYTREAHLDDNQKVVFGLETNFELNSLGSAVSRVHGFFNIKELGIDDVLYLESIEALHLYQYHRLELIRQIKMDFSTKKLFGELRKRVEKDPLSLKLLDSIKRIASEDIRNFVNHDESYLLTWLDLAKTVSYSLTDNVPASVKTAAHDFLNNVSQYKATKFYKTVEKYVNEDRMSVMTPVIQPMPFAVPIMVAPGGYMNDIQNRLKELNYVDKVIKVVLQDEA